MPYSATVRRSASVANSLFSESVKVTADASVGVNLSIPAAKTGTLTTRTDNDTGTLTMSASHGIQTGDVIDLYWATGARYNVTVGTVSVNSVPIDGGTGDNLPSTSTAVTAQVKQVQSLGSVTMNNVVAILVECPKRSTVTFRSSGATVELNIPFTGDTGGGYIWTSSDIGSNPMSGDTIVDVAITQEDSDTTMNARVTLLYN